MIQLNHIGIAVQNLPKLKELFGVLGLNVSHTEVVPPEGVTTHFLPMNTQGASLEFLEPLPIEGPAGTIAKFLDKRGPGIHHLAFSVGKGALEPLCDVLRQKGFRLIYPQPRPGAHGTRVNFIHPQSAGGLLIEVIESL